MNILAASIYRNAFSSCGRRMKNQHGQALTEFLVAALAIIPLFLLIPLIGKYQDISNATMMAGRYAAFDATTHNAEQGGWKPSDQLADELRRRFFSNSDAPIKTKDTAGDFKANQNLLWVDPQGHALIANFGNDIKLGFGTENQGSHGSADFSSASDGKPFNQVIDYPAQLKVVPHGIYRANVSVTIANIAAISGSLKTYQEFENINLIMTRGTSLVIDPWSANSVAQTEQRFSSDPRLFPSGPLTNIAGLVDANVRIVDVLGGLQGPKLGQLDFWRDIVPEDRLKQ
jgi:hypothetical protein